ncbi:uncharacterized protein N7459_006608 [Penicillium hispanicum]|uniref:uncharacterized protein n=1 Tax=Penicillium hispanicum TaxID=1080232 RepID=UPI002540C16B|nr:uncharacterized protein N7459_006608 [Penicillium hispanicum]KAJ5577644.1 hypothetical protein N7459_006608 [Penicillium hispanicum]
MFASHPPSTPFRQTGHYTPARPSPLGQRSSNIATPPWTMNSPTRPGNAHKPSADENANAHCSPVSFPAFSMHTSQPQAEAQTQSPSPFQLHHTPLPDGTSRFSLPAHTTSALMSPTSPSPSARPKFADRYAAQIANPMKNATSLARSKTRKIFLNRVRNERDAGRFEARGEQMMMAEHMADKRRWEEAMARDADGVLVGVEGEDDMLPDEKDLVELEEYVSQEQAMETALMETVGEPNGQQMRPSAEPSVSFSDDEYDDIFMTLDDPVESHQEMDMS